MFANIDFNLLSFFLIESDVKQLVDPGDLLWFAGGGS
jgi:hypothetical protein